MNTFRLLTLLLRLLTLLPVLRVILSDRVQHANANEQWSRAVLLMPGSIIDTCIYCLWIPGSIIDCLYDCQASPWRAITAKMREGVGRVEDRKGGRVDVESMGKDEDGKRLGY